MSEVNATVNQSRVHHPNFLSAPLFVWWDVTKRCNLACRHCYSRSSEDADCTNELTTDEARKLIDELAAMRVFFVSFLGGEPFTRRDLMELIEYAKSVHLGVTVNSNGWYITREIAKELNRLDTNQCRISIDGATAETHDWFRGRKGSYERGVRAIVYLKESGIRDVGMASTIARHNVHEADKICDLAYELRVDNIQFLPIAPSGRAGDNYDSVRLSPAESAGLRKTLDRKRKEYAGRLMIYSSDGVLPRPCHQCILRGAVRPDFMGCPAARTCCNIDCNGDVLPCLLVRNPVAGNVKHTDFREIWERSCAFADWRAERLRHDECVQCEWSDVCNRECPLSDSQRSCGGQERREAIHQLTERWKDTKGCVLAQACSGCAS